MPTVTNPDGTTTTTQPAAVPIPTVTASPNQLRLAALAIGVSVEELVRLLQLTPPAAYDPMKQTLFQGTGLYPNRHGSFNPTATSGPDSVAPVPFLGSPSDGLPH